MRMFLLAVFLILVSACTPTPPAPHYAPITFTDKAPIKLNVAEIQIAQEYKPSFAAPYVEHLFIYPPETLVKQWAKDRLVAGGDSGYLRVVIKDASVKEVHLDPTEKGIKGLVTIEQSERYDANVVVKLELYKDDALFPKAEVELNAQQSKTIAENATLLQREGFYYNMSKSVMAAFDDQVDKLVREYFNEYLM